MFNRVIARFRPLVAQAVRVIGGLFWLRFNWVRRCIYLCTLDGLFLHNWDHVARGRLRIFSRKVSVGFLVIQIRQSLHTRGLKINFPGRVLRRLHFICRHQFDPQVDHTFRIIVGCSKAWYSICLLRLTPFSFKRLCLVMYKHVDMFALGGAQWPVWRVFNASLPTLGSTLLLSTKGSLRGSLAQRSPQLAITVFIRFGLWPAVLGARSLLSTLVEHLWLLEISI